MESQTDAPFVLLLEDEALIAIDIEVKLEAAGFAVASIPSCAEAAALLDERLPDVAIVDILLADGASYGLVDRLVEADVPFIVHSGDLPSMHADTALALGTWISKPTPSPELVAAVQALIES